MTDTDTSAVFDPAVVLALLEGEPQSTAELAALLELPADTVRRGCLGMARERSIKRVGEAQRWALYAYVAPVGRRPSVNRDECRAAIRRLLDGTALSTEALMVRTGYSKNVVKLECALMQQAGQLTHFGKGRGSCWCLPGYRRPDALSLTGQGVPGVKRKPTPEQRMRQGSSSGTVPAAVFHAPKVKTPIDAEGSWWVAGAQPDAPREVFTTAAQHRDADMCTKSAAWRRRGQPNTMAVVYSAKDLLS
jgi:hypothetical protein